MNTQPIFKKGETVIIKAGARPDLVAEYPDCDMTGRIGTIIGVQPVHYLVKFKGRAQPISYSYKEVEPCTPS